MPARRIVIGRTTRRNQNSQRYLANLTPAQRAQTQERTRIRVARNRAEEMEEQRNQRLATMRVLRRTSRNYTTDVNRRLSQLTNRLQLQLSSYHRVAFNYDPAIEYCAQAEIVIGNMDKECNFCHALKFKNETVGMCCSSGKVVLPALNAPPEPLKSLMSGENAESKLFLKIIRKINSCFQMSSFAAKIIPNINAQGVNYNTTFKIQGQVYHQIGSLLPLANETPKFLQIYFMGDEDEQVNVRCQFQHIRKIQERLIVSTLETFLAENNHLIQLFKSMSRRLQNDNYMIVIKADKVPSGEHARRFNAPTVNEVGIVMVGDAFEL